MTHGDKLKMGKQKTVPGKRVTLKQNDQYESNGEKEIRNKGVGV